MSEPDEAHAAETEVTGAAPRERPAVRVRLGIALILLSGVFWFSLLAVPFLPLNVAQKSALGFGLFVGVQVAWWVGAAIAGPTAVGQLMSWVRRMWPRRNTPTENSAADKT